MNSSWILSILLLFISIGSIPIAAKHPRDVVKDVGKRYLDNIFVGTLQKIRFTLMSDEDYNRTKHQESEKIGLLIQAQSSEENWSWRESATTVESLMSTFFEGSICGGPKLNYVQFLEYWTRKRKDYHMNVYQQPIKFAHLPTEFFTLTTFELSFTMNSKFDYSEQAVYIVQLELRGENEANSYTIMGINEIAPCTDTGKIDWSSKYSPHIRIKDGEPGEEKIIQEYLMALFQAHEDIHYLPEKWFWDATSKSSFFEGKMCTDGRMRTISKLHLAVWWQKFQLMWHMAPGLVNVTTVQLMGGTKGRYVFRLTLHLQIGPNWNRAIQEWNFRLQMQYNVHGDEMWYINVFEILCPVYSEKKLMEQHAEVFKEMLGARMDKILLNPAQWYSSTDVFNDFIAPDKPVVFESCAGTDGEEMETSTSLADLEHKFWKKNKAEVGKLVGVDLGRAHDSSSVSETMWMQIFAIWPPLAENTVYESSWSFHIQWNVDYQFYEIIKIAFKCPEQSKGNKEYTPLDALPKEESSTVIE